MQKSGAWSCTRRSGLIVLAMTTMMAAGCGGGGGGSGASASPSGVSAPSGGNNSPTISGSPAGEARVGANYSVTPQAQDSDGDALAFSIQNKPDWALFNTATGELSGSPRAQHVGVNSDVTISVSDGRVSVALAPFSITVSAGTSVPVDGASVALSWDVPTTTVDGAAVSDLAGYRIHYGFKANALTEAVEVPSAGLNTYVVEGLKKGTYYFVVRAITANGGQSDTSNVVSKVIS
jgi:Putative Ig domain